MLCKSTENDINISHTIKSLMIGLAIPLHPVERVAPLANQSLPDKCFDIAQNGGQVAHHIGTGARPKVPR